MKKKKIIQYCRTAVVLHETEGRREARELSQEAARSDGGSGAGLVNTDAENNLIGDGQGQVEERQLEGQGLNSNSEGRSGTGSQGSGTEAILATKCKRQKQSAQKRNREKGDDGDDEDNFLHARVPKNILKKLALLSVKLKMSV